MFGNAQNAKQHFHTVVGGGLPFPNSTKSTATSLFIVSRNIRKNLSSLWRCTGRIELGRISRITIAKLKEDTTQAIARIVQKKNRCVIIMTVASRRLRSRSAQKARYQAPLCI